MLYVIFLIVILAVLVLVIAMQPTDFRVSRSITINAPASAPYALINDFHQWISWSPYEKMDPAMKRTYGGAPAGAGSTYAWAGNANIGEGSMKIIESRPDELIRMDLAFLKPFKASNTAEFTFRHEGDNVIVTWSMSGKRNFMAKGMGLVMNFDKMIGNQFDQGLATLKSLAERGAR